jgi:hypothetical protein
MPASVVAICNRALDLLGQAPIVSLADDTPPGRIMSRQYALSRDVVLRSGFWNSATRRALLAADATAPAWGYARQFLLPVDCLMVTGIEADDLYGEPWRVEGRHILTDAAGPLRVRYVALIEDPGLMDPLLAEAITIRLAADCAASIPGSASMKESLEAQYQATLRLGRAMDAKEQSQDEKLNADDWLAARIMVTRY